MGEIKEIRPTLKSADDLEVFRRSYQASLHVHSLSRRLPKEEQYGLAEQLRRSSKSICANITEGFAKRHQSSAELKRFLMIGFGSAEETLLWLRYCKDLSLIPLETIEPLTKEYTEISKMLFALHRNWRA